MSVGEGERAMAREKVGVVEDIFEDEKETERPRQRQRDRDR
jgi:hypothetical protein